MRPRPVGQREHEPAHGGGIADGRSREGLRNHYPETCRATAVDADVAQLRIRELTAKSPGHRPPDSRIVRRSGYPDPQGSGGAIAGVDLRLIERLAACQQARDLIQSAALDERRMAGPTQAAV